MSSTTKVAVKKEKIVEEEEVSVEVETSVQEEASSSEKTKKRPTLESHLAQYNELVKLLDEEVDRMSKDKEKGSRKIRKIRKVVKQLMKEVPVIAKQKRERNRSKPSGLEVPIDVTPALKAFLKLKDGDVISRRDLTRAICIYIKYDPDDKRVETQRWAYLNSG